MRKFQRASSHEQEEQDGPLDSDLDQGAGEEANCPAGGAQVDGGVLVGRVRVRQYQDFNFKHLCI